MNVIIEPAPEAFSNWTGLHKLLTEAFSGMEGRIDPPSSLKKMTPHTLAEKARLEHLLIAHIDTRLIGCGFGTAKDDTLYLSKLAIAPEFQRFGLMRRMLENFETYATSAGLSSLTLETRIELTENHKAFENLGFVKTEETAHPGYDRPTGYTYLKTL